MEAFSSLRPPPVTSLCIFSLKCTATEVFNVARFARIRSNVLCFWTPSRRSHHPSRPFGRDGAPRPCWLFFRRRFKLECVICQPKHHAAAQACNLNKHPFNTFQTAEMPLPSCPPCLRKSPGENVSAPSFLLTYLFTPPASSRIFPPKKSRRANVYKRVDAFV